MAIRPLHLPPALVNDYKFERVTRCARPHHLHADGIESRNASATVACSEACARLQDVPDSGSVVFAIFVALTFVTFVGPPS